MQFIISGVVREKESGIPVPGLLVRAFDKDLIFHDLLGNAVTASDGTFSIGYNEKDFREIFEKRPDIFLHIYGRETADDPGRTGDVPIYSTKTHVRFNAGRREFFAIELTREVLGDDSPGGDVIGTPEPGEWKDIIDEYIREHPIDFPQDPDKDYAAPKLDCSSNFGPEIRDAGLAEPVTVTVPVKNKGNGISFSAYVQVYEGPVGYISPLSAYRLCDYKIITIHPGQTQDVKLIFTRLLDRGRIVGVCFDPFLDPRGFNLVEQYNDHITSIHYL